MEPTPNLNKSLAAARGKFPAIHKGRTATVKMRDNKGQYSYDYADLADVLDSVQPVLSANGLVLTHEQQTTREPLGVETVAVLLHESGEEKRGLPCWLPCSGDMQPTQAIGSAMTYGRRYTTGPILGISPEADDDGNGASGNDAETKPKAEKPACPKCGKGESVIPGKEEFGGGWLCWKKSKTPGCGHEWETPERKFCGSKAFEPKPPKLHAGLGADLAAIAAACGIPRGSQAAMGDTILASLGTTIATCLEHTDIAKTACDALDEAHKTLTDAGLNSSDAWKRVYDEAVKFAG